MKHALPISMAILTVALIAVGSIQPGNLVPATTAERAVQSLFEAVKGGDYQGAYSYVANPNEVGLESFKLDLTGREGSLRTYSSLQKSATKVMRESSDDATVRADMQWSTAVGAISDTRDLKVVREGRNWKVMWPVEKQPVIPAQVVPVNYLRWDIVARGINEDWGAGGAESPRIRIVSMNAIERDGNTIILGEVVNDDTVPAFLSVLATLIGKDGSTLGEESSFDRVSHTLLPKEVSPFRIDFPGIKLDTVKSVRMTPNSTLVPASADPVISVLHQRVETDARGRHVLKGELGNQSGQIVNIPHVLATYYDNAGKVIWVSDGYVDRPLLPQSTVPFAVDLRDDLASKVQTYRVTVNHYSLGDRQ